MAYVNHGIKPGPKPGTELITWEERLATRVKRDANGCWIYYYENGQPAPYHAHKLFYEHYKGDIPEGQFVLHTCDNKACVNPDHLWLGTQTDNMQDMIAKGRKVYNYGHEVSEETRQKLSKANLGKKQSEETKKKLSKIMLGNQYGLGTVLSAEARAIISANSSKPRCGSCKWLDYCAKKYGVHGRTWSCEEYESK